MTVNKNLEYWITGLAYCARSVSLEKVINKVV